MREYTVKLNKSKTVTEQGKTLFTYGISVRTNGKSIEYTDLSFDKARVETLARLLESERVEEKFIKEIVEDFIV